MDNKSTIFDFLNKAQKGQKSKGTEGELFPQLINTAVRDSLMKKFFSVCTQVNVGSESAKVQGIVA